MATRKRAFTDGPRGTERELAKLRRDQDLVTQQLESAYRQGNTKAIERLQAMQLDLDRRVDALAFPGESECLDKRGEALVPGDTVADFSESRSYGLGTYVRPVAGKPGKIWVDFKKHGEAQRWCTEVVKKNLTPNHAAVHYVWLLDYRGVPLDTEGPYGPMSLTRAEQFARIGATNGDHDRVVSLGGNVMESGFQILRRYRRGTGERVL
jgi:hypothetical protein